jgi:hypothetical protein
VSRDCGSYEYHVYNEDGTRLNTSPLSSEATYSDGWFTINAGGKETKMDKKGKLEAPFFKSREPLGDSLYIVTQESSYIYGLYDAKEDKMILPCAYESLFYSKESQTCIVKVRTREGVWKKAYPEIGRVLDGQEELPFINTIVNNEFIDCKRPFSFDKYVLSVTNTMTISGNVIKKTDKTK